MKNIHLLNFNMRRILSALEILNEKTAIRLFRSSPLRYVLAVFMSTILHVAILGGYSLLTSFDHRAVLEIREITFVDLSEAPVRKTEPEPEMLSVKKESSRGLVTKSVEPAKGTVIARRQLEQAGDSPVNGAILRLQAPISLGSHSAIAMARPDGSDIIRVSPARGSRNARTLSNPVAAISLGKQERLERPGTAQMVSFRSQGQPHAQIALNPKGRIVEMVASESAVGLPVLAGKNRAIEPAAMESNTSITGPLARRRIRKKVIPRFPLWAKRKGVGAAISLQFTVMQDGRVKENIAVVRTSGSKEWDNQVIQTLGNWLFVPLTHSSERTQTGTITFQFRID
ncbi:MAG: TonB family protein [Caldithrix sp.]|nr:MAG: TonB family protein [Caldithrix sp.]